MLKVGLFFLPSLPASFKDGFFPPPAFSPRFLLGARLPVASFSSASIAGVGGEGGVGREEGGESSSTPNDGGGAGGFGLFGISSGTGGKEGGDDSISSSAFASSVALESNGGGSNGVTDGRSESVPS